MNTKRLLVIIFLTVILAAAVWFVLDMTAEKRLETRAEALIAQGDFEGAQEIYLELGDMDRVRQCMELIRNRSYNDAAALLESGEFSAAKDIFISLGDYSDAKNMVSECDYRLALYLFGSGDLPAAREAFEKLGSYSDSAAMLEKTNAEIYARAQSMMLANNYADALSFFSLVGDYLDAPVMADRCSARVEAEADPNRSIIDSANLYQRFSTGNLYIADTGYVFIPNAPDENTDFLIFFPGGRDIEEPRDYIYNYLEASSENTVTLFLYKNGLGDMYGKCKEAFDTLDRAASECGIAVRDPVICGTSMGAYPAMRAAVYYYETYGKAVMRVMCFDAGVDWEEEELTLDARECKVMAEAGTEFWLLEQYGVGMNRSGINLMAYSGCRVMMIVCANQDHNSILYDALNCGMVNYAFGRTGPIESANYSYVNLSPYSTYPD
ncbi:MAG: hypothetical protein Q4E35_04475 [Eubacteriales bacterium]|nr:hypothetical protein [Eubacteriales bacterium]